MATASAPLPDLVARLRALYAALQPDRDLWLDAAWLRFAAQAAVALPEPPGVVADRIRAFAAALARDAGWMDPLASPLRYVIAATLVASGDRPEAFLADCERAHAVLRAGGVRRGGWHELVAILVLRLLRFGEPLTAGDVAMMRGLYQRMRLKHWFLTGRDDLPACALLADLGRPAEALAAAIEAAFAGLRAIGLPANDHTQLAADLLQLAGLDPAAAVARLRAIAEALYGTLESLPRAQVEALALLACAPGEPAALAERLRATRGQLDALAPLLYGEVNTAIAADLVVASATPALPAVQARRLQAASLCLVRVPMIASSVPIDLPGYFPGPFGTFPAVSI